MADKILIFPNTPWEADALTAVFRNAKATPANFPTPLDTPISVDLPLPDGSKSQNVKARLSYPDFEVWCVHDLAIGGPSTAEKARALSLLSESRGPASLAVAFGTSAFADQQSYDGSVVVGSNYFNYSPFQEDENPPGSWMSESLGKLVDNAPQRINQAVFGNLKNQLRLSIESRFLRPPVDSAQTPYLIVSAGYTAISDVNVANPDDYAWADRDAVKEFANSYPRQQIGSVETTHGVIGESVKHDQFLFFSAIANRLGYFNMEAAPRNYAQDFAVAHNAAVALAWLLPTVLPVGPVDAAA
jgi:hypothetical protein